MEIAHLGIGSCDRGVRTTEHWVPFYERFRRSWTGAQGQDLRSHHRQKWKSLECSSKVSLPIYLLDLIVGPAPLTPALAETIALCLMFGVLPLIGFSLLGQSIIRWLRSGRLETYSRGGKWNVYYRSQTPVQFWLALVFKAVSLFALCAFPLVVCVLFLLPRLIDILRGGSGAP